jgi:acyl carrier protein phosphodiesterase
MNYLAHMVIGGLEPERLLGNFIGDSVKGRAFENYTLKVRAGILLHRHIDSGADEHPGGREIRALLRPALGRMSAVGVDLLCDFMLANQFERWSPEGMALREFADTAYRRLEEQKSSMPERSRRFLEVMMRADWLAGYGDVGVMRQVCQLMDARVAWHSNLVNLMDVWPEVEGRATAAFEAMFTELHGRLGCR